ncbi:hypothetical protein J437_LFUL012723 [Ladona fulva]|uniref:Luciferase n=1 Tax=Ladona fulva TaxID=123851 RepID=A0A8K0KN16_LADFU|nr:hypothetical protein J437_LFUL012723 [Ladona fulva]
MKEVYSRFILIEKETANLVKSATASLEWEVQYLSIGGDVEGSIPIEDMIFKDDGSGKETRFGQCSLLCLANFSGVAFSRFYYCMMVGETFINVPKFDEKSFLGYIEKYKPDSLHLFPYITSWMVQSADVEKYDLSFVKKIVTAGSVLPVTLLKGLSEKLPHVRVYQLYGMTEVIMIATEDSWHCAEIRSPENCETLGGLKITKLDNETHVSCGVLTPFAKAKIVDVQTGKCLGRGVKGKLLVKVPYHMKGYIRKSIQDYNAELDGDGFFDTGDIAFFDNDDHLYIVERLKSVFKYFSHHVFPSEIETLINMHAAVSNCAVVGVPNPMTSYLARAYVVLKPGSQVTEDEIMDHVASRFLGHT